MKKFLLLAVSIISLTGCQTTSLSKPKWTKATPGKIPVFLDKEFNSRKDFNLNALQKYSQSGTPPFDTSKFIECNLSNDKSKEISGILLIEQDFVDSDIAFELHEHHLKATPSDCVFLQQETPNNVKYYSHFKYSAGKTTKDKTVYTKLESGGSTTLDMVNLTFDGSAYSKTLSVTYAKKDRRFSINQMGNSPIYNSAELYTTTSDEGVYITYSGELLSMVSEVRNNIMDGYYYSYLTDKPRIVCYKAGIPSSSEYCNTARVSPETKIIIELAKQGKKPIPIIDKSKPVQPNDSLDIWAITGGLAATVYGVNGGLATDSAAAIGAGTYDLISNGDSTQLTNATNSLEMKNQHNSPSQRVTVRDENSQSISTNYANNLDIAKLEALIKINQQQGGNTSSLESLLKSEYSKPKNPNSRQVSLRPNLIDNYPFCQNKSLDIQIATHCQAAILYYTQYLGEVGGANEKVIYDAHVKSSQITKKLYDVTLQ